MMKLLDYISAAAAIIFSLIFRFIPISLTLWLARRLSVLPYLFTPYRRTIGYANLRAAFCHKRSPEELKRLIRGVYASFTQTFFEIISLTKIDKKYIEKYIEVMNIKERYWLAGYPKGVIMLTAHFDNWELSAAVSALKGFPLVVLAREQSMKKLYELLNRLRESKGLQVVRKGITLKYIVKALHEGKIIGVVGDQNAGKTGVFLNFMGRPASVAPGAARIAAKTGAYILPAFSVRIKGPYHKVYLEEPMKIEKNEDVTPYLEKYTRLLEDYLTKYPEQWLWLHKRWKVSPLKKVVILSDGKAGHLNQAKAVFELLKKYREDSGYAPTDTELAIVEIRFKNRFLKDALNILSLFAGRNCQGCMRCLKFCLTKDSYENLMRKYSDIVISSGSSVAGVNRFFSIENNAKSACIMKPSILGYKKFDMAILPQHDAKSRAEGRLITTETVPNLINAEYLENASEVISKMAKLEKPVKIGVLLGGDNSDFTLTEKTTEELLKNVIGAAKKLDADILFTTSRRTPKPSEKLIKETLYPESRCKFLVIPNEKNIKDAVGGILGLSDIIVVSGESASMVSEAVTSEKPVIAFRLKKKRNGFSKFDRMLGNLEKKGFVVTAEANELSDVICKVFNNPGLKAVPQDMYTIYKYMWRLGV